MIRTAMPLQSSIGGAQNKILVVDDSMVERENIKSILSAFGYQVIEAENGEAAIQMAQEQRPDLIFLDIIMPGMDGFAVCRNLHRDEKTASIPIIMLSSKSNRSDQVWAKQMGAADYITKPYDKDDILHTVEKYIK